MTVLAAEVQERRYTVEEYINEGLYEDEDGFKYELIGGRLVPKQRRQSGPSAEHAKIVTKISQFLANYLDNNGIGQTYSGGACLMDEITGDYYIPDVMFLTNQRVPANQEDTLPYPDLAIEVVSRTDIWYDVRAKVGKYLQTGTRMVWIVFAPDREVQVYRSGSKKIYADQDELDGGDLLPNFKIAVSRVFA